MIYAFNQCRLDSGRFQLTRGDETVSVEPLVFDLLVYLVENRDRVVSRDELLENLWKGKVVTDSALGVRLKDARKAVGDSGSQQAVIKTIHGRGYQFVAAVTENPAAQDADESRSSPGRVIGLADQSPVRFCSSADGTRIAYAQVGSGYPMVSVGSWMTHLEEDWYNPTWGHYLSHLARDFTVIRYDQRGNGMSDWDDVEITFERMVEDLKAVIDCYDYDRVALFGPSQAASVSLAFARQYPEKVSHLILHGAYVRGRCRRGNPEEAAESEALVTMIRQSWGRDNPVARQMMTSLFMPDASREDMAWFNEFQKNCGPGDNIARFREVFDNIDISGQVAEIDIPTLVVHSAGDSAAPLAEGKFIASRIPGARLVTLNSKNHMVFENEPGFGRFLDAVREFMRSA